MVVLAGCGGGGGNDPTPEPLALITEAASKIRASKTFRLYVEQTGATYHFQVYLDEARTKLVNAEFEFARAQYVADDTLQANARILIDTGLGQLAQDVTIFSQGTDQWYRLASLPWIKGDFAPGFNPATLIADDSGFQAALTALTDLQFVEEKTLEDGTPTYHFKGNANGPAIKGLVVGLINFAEVVPVDVFVNRDDHYPVRLILTQPETVTEIEKIPTTWTIDVYDVDEPSELTPPDAAKGE
ncbi:MAG TPA: LppX_LprAFG lipoprotein [Phototrophicaceae bacterium]|jgi:hypothetical protein|nr:LppX_LprAFG lipoprotein [Phototrophicaceae bacterium]